MLIRTECAVRGEELYMSFRIAPEIVRKIMNAVFQFYASLHVSTDGTVPTEVMIAYLQATATVHEMQNNICTDGIAAFGQFVHRYLYAFKRMNSLEYFQLPERSTDEITNRVCEFYTDGQYDPLPDFLAKQAVLDHKLPSQNVRLPDALPWFFCPPHCDDVLPLLLLQRVAVAAAECDDYLSR